MGNCIHVILSQNISIRSRRKQQLAEQKYFAKVHPDPVLSALRDEGKTNSGDSPEPVVYQTTANHLVNPPVMPHLKPTDDISKRRTVKVVVIKKQLRGLLKNVKELEATGTADHFSESFWEKERSPGSRWWPSLDTIAE